MNNDNLICPICGEPTRVYMGKARKDRLCGKHADMLKAGELILNEDGSYTTPQLQASERKTVDASELTCIICGVPSNGKHFCLKCYREYKDHSIDIRITNCRETEIIDRYGNKKIKTKDGRFVRSLSEKIILDYFFDHYTRVVYEKTVPYVNDKGENAELHPDFYLQDYNLYIEFNGLTNKTYLRKKDYVSKIYASKGLKVIILDSDDINDIEGTLDQILDQHKRK